MFLSVDVGNTQTTFGLIDDAGSVLQHWRTKTDKLGNILVAAWEHSEWKSSFLD